MERLKHIVEINIVLGLWLLAAPFVLGYSGSTVELTTSAAAGVWLIAFAWWMLVADSGQVAAGVLQILGGLALAAAPFLLHYQRMARPFDNDVAVGVLCFVVSVVATWTVASRLRAA